jgi:hypothetical protein
VQTGIVFSQRYWPGVKDVGDDCWALTVIQATNVVAPWLRLASVTEVRAAAGDPDDGKSDGGSLTDVVRGAIGTYPILRGKLEVLKGAPFTEMQHLLRAGRPMSVALMADRLPARLSHGVKVPHQVTLAYKSDGTLLMANPWAAPAERWAKCSWDAIDDAILAYGKARDTRRGVWGAAWPTEATMWAAYTPVDDPTPYDAEDIAAATKALIAERDALAAKVAAAIDVLD